MLNYDYHQLKYIAKCTTLYSRRILLQDQYPCYTAKHLFTMHPWTSQYSKTQVNKRKHGFQEWYINDMSCADTKHRLWIHMEIEISGSSNLLYWYLKKQLVTTRWKWWSPLQYWSVSLCCLKGVCGVWMQKRSNPKLSFEYGPPECDRKDRLGE